MDYDMISYRKYALLAVISAIAIAMIISLSLSSSAHAEVASSTASSTNNTFPSPTCTLSVTPSSINTGQYATLSWTSTNATSLGFDQGLGFAFPTNQGQLSVSPTNTQTYTGTALGTNASSTCEVTLTVNPQSTNSSSSTTMSTTGSPTIPGETTNATATNSSGTTLPVTSIIVPPPYPTSGSTPAPMIVSVDSSGNSTIRGIVKFIGNNLITLSTWGGTWSIRTDNAETNASTNVRGDVSGISVGDFVGAAGKVADDQLFTQDATVVRDWTKTGGNTATTNTSNSAAGDTSDTKTNNTGSVSGTAESLYTGTVSNLGTDSFTLTNDGGQTYTVNLRPDTTIWNNARNVIDLSQIQAGDSIRINGILRNDGSITASVVRDTAI